MRGQLNGLGLNGLCIFPGGYEYGGDVVAAYLDGCGCKALVAGFARTMLVLGVGLPCATCRLRLVLLSEQMNLVFVSEIFVEKRRLENGGAVDHYIPDKPILTGSRNIWAASKSASGNRSFPHDVNGRVADVSEITEAQLAEQLTVTGSEMSICVTLMV